jgi:hypothetical protein
MNRLRKGGAVIVKRKNGMYYTLRWGEVIDWILGDPPGEVVLAPPKNHHG